MVRLVLASATGAALALGAAAILAFAVPAHGSSVHTRFVVFEQFKGGVGTEIVIRKQRKVPYVAGNYAVFRSPLRQGGPTGARIGINEAVCLHNFTHDMCRGTFTINGRGTISYEGLASLAAAAARARLRDHGRHRRVPRRRRVGAQRRARAQPEGIQLGDHTHRLKEGELADYAVKRIDDLEGAFGGAFKRARAELGVTSFGLQILDLPPNFDQYPDHDHSQTGRRRCTSPCAAPASWRSRGSGTHSTRTRSSA